METKIHVQLVRFAGGVYVHKVFVDGSLIGDFSNVGEMLKFIGNLIVDHISAGSPPPSFTFENVGQ